MTIVATITAENDGGAHLEQSIADLLKIVREQLQLDVVFVAEFVGGNRVFRHLSSNHELSLHPGDFHAREDSLCQQIVDGSLPKVVPDIAALRTAQKLPQYELPIGLHIGVPVCLTDGRTYGTLCGFTFAPSRHLNERHVKRMEMAAAATARLLAQAEGHDLVVLEEADIVTIPGALT